jgi:hypothetical protein
MSPAAPQHATQRVVVVVVFVDGLPFTAPMLTNLPILNAFVALSRERAGGATPDNNHYRGAPMPLTELMTSWLFALWLSCSGTAYYVAATAAERTMIDTQRVFANCGVYTIDELGGSAEMRRDLHAHQQAWFAALLQYHGRADRVVGDEKELMTVIYTSQMKAMLPVIFRLQQCLMVRSRNEVCALYRRAYMRKLHVELLVSDIQQKTKRTKRMNHELLVLQRIHADLQIQQQTMQTWSSSSIIRFDEESAQQQVAQQHQMLKAMVASFHPGESLVRWLIK